MANWIGKELTKPVPSNTPMDEKRKSKTKTSKHKAVPRDMNELLKTVLLQDGIYIKLLLLPHVMACIVRFMQTYDMRIDTPVFKVGYLVDNRTMPAVYWMSNNPRNYSLTPRHMPCLQQQFGENYGKGYINYFSDLSFQQPEDP